ncbi:MAG: AbrB/MazE/SpoVT family DNA-binding domain-containing protein [Candidatus Sulfotelmatobacter sp.]
MAFAKMTSKGQITIPVRIRREMGLRNGDRVHFDKPANGSVTISAASRSIRELKGLLYKKGRKPVTIEDMNEAIARGAAGLE